MGPVGVVLIAQAMEGGDIFTRVFLLSLLASGFNGLYAALYLGRHGTVRRERSGRRRGRPVGAKHRFERRPVQRRISRLELERLRRALGRQRWKVLWRWLRGSIEPRLKYPWRFYVPWGGGQHGRYFVFVVVDLALSLAGWYCEVLLVQRHMPLSIATFCLWASHCWLAIAMAGALFARPRRWSVLAVPAIGALSLVGVAVASGILSGKGIDSDLLTDPVVIALLAQSLVSAWFTRFNKKTRLREEKYYEEVLGHLEPEDHIYLSTKLAFWPTVLFFFFCAVGFVVSGLRAGFPHVEHWGLFLAVIGLYVVVSLGNRASVVALFEGEPALNGIGAAGGLGFIFAWTWIFQGIGIQGFQLVGAAITFASAVALAFTEERVRALASRLWRHWLRKVRSNRRGRKHA